MNCNLTMGSENLNEYKNNLIKFRSGINYIEKLAKNI